MKTLLGMYILILSIVLIVLGFGYGLFLAMLMNSLLGVLLGDLLIGACFFVSYRLMIIAIEI